MSRDTLLNILGTTNEKLVCIENDLHNAYWEQQKTITTTEYKSKKDQIDDLALLGRMAQKLQAIINARSV